MLNMTIGDKDYDVNFGIAFVRELDKKHSEAYGENIKYGVGLMVMLSKLLIGDVTALEDIIYAGTCTEGKRPSQKDMDEFIDTHEDIDALFEEVIEELKKSNACKKQATMVTAKVEEAQKAESTTKS